MKILKVAWTIMMIIIVAVIVSVLFYAQVELKAVDPYYFLLSP